MQNLTFGIASVLICAVIYFYAWKVHHTKGNYIFSLFLLILAGVILRFYVGTDFYLHEWDERYHALVAKNLIQHPFVPTLYDDPIFSFDYRAWAANHIWVHKQPLSLWSMAISLNFFGINEVALRLPSILFSSGAIFLTYRIADLLFDNKQIAFLAAFFHSIHGLSIEMGGGRIATDHVDVLFQFLIELGVYFVLLSLFKKNKKFLILIGVTTGFAILTKWLPAGIVIGLWLIFQFRDKEIDLWETGRNLFLISFSAVAVFLPWQIYILNAFPLEAKWEYAYNSRHLFEALEGHSTSFFYHFNKLRINYGELIYLPLIWFLYYAVKLKDRRAIINALVLITWILIPFLFFSFAKTKMQGYTLFTAPAIFIISSFFMVHLQRTAQNKYVKITIIALLLLLPIRYSIERIKPFQKRDRNPEWTVKIRNLAKKLDDKKEAKIVLLNIPRPIETMFYCRKGVMAYDYIPKKEELAKAKENGYVIFLVEEGEDEFFIFPR